MRIRDKSAAGRKKCRMMVIAVLLATVALSMSAFAGQWKQDDTGWWYQNEDGTYVKSEWSWIDGRCYYFNEDGYCLQNTQTPDGYSVDGQGAWIEGGVVQMQQEVQAQMQEQVEVPQQEPTGVQEQSQDSGAIKQIGNVLLTVPEDFCISFL